MIYFVLVNFSSYITNNLLSHYHPCIYVDWQFRFGFSLFFSCWMKVLQIKFWDVCMLFHGNYSVIDWMNHQTLSCSSFWMNLPSIVILTGSSDVAWDNATPRRRITFTNVLNSDFLWNEDAFREEEPDKFDFRGVHQKQIDNFYSFPCEISEENKKW